MRILARGFLMTAVLAIATSSAYADELLSNLDTSPGMPKPKEIRVVKLGKDGKGDRNELLGFTTLKTHNELRVTPGFNGDVAVVRIAGVSVGMETLISPGISMQMGIVGIDKDSTYVWDAIRITAKRSGAGYQIFLRTITEAQVFGEDPTRSDTWLLARNDQGRWGLVHEQSGSPSRFVETIVAHLVLKDPKEGTGFKGVSRYVTIPRALAVSEPVPGANDPRVHTNPDKPASSVPGAEAAGTGEKVSAAAGG